MGVNDDIADAVVTGQIGVLQVRDGYVNKTIGLLNDLERDLIDQLQRRAPTDPTRSSVRQRRAQALLEQTQEQIRTFRRTAQRDLNRDLKAFAKAEVVDFAADLNAAVGGSVFTVETTPETLNALVRRTRPWGSPLGDWWDQQEGTLRRNFNRQVNLGVLNGEPTGDIVRRIRGRGRGTGDGGIMEASRTQATTLVRTAVHEASNQAHKEVADQNIDLIKGHKALVTFDSRTSKICIARSGGIWNTVTGDPLPDSPRQEPFPGYPPWHPNCRTVLTPVLKSLADLVREQGGTPPEGLTDFDPGERSSIDGRVPADQDYETWLRGKSPGFRRKVLGPKRAEMFEQGKLNLRDLVDNRGHTRTLPELRQLRKETRKRRSTKPEPKPEPKPTRRPKVKPAVPGGDKQAKPTGLVKPGGTPTSKMDGKTLRETLEAEIGTQKIEDMRRDINERKKLERVPKRKKDAQWHLNAHKAVQKERETRKVLDGMADRGKPFITIDPEDRMPKPKLGRVEDIPGSISRVSGKRKEAMKAKAEQAATFIASIASKAVLGRRSEVNYNVRADPSKSTRYRAHARPDLGYIQVSDRSTVRTYVHEIMHIVESSPGAPAALYANNVEWVRQRGRATKGTDRPKQLSRIRPGYRHKRHEIAVDDEFVNPYVGRVYKQEASNPATKNATEVMTVAVEILQRNPIELLVEDPDLFEHIIDVLRGYKL